MQLGNYYERARGRLVLFVVAGFMLLFPVIILLRPEARWSSMSVNSSESKEALQKSNNKYKHSLFGGLLNPDFNESSCLSRYQSASYWKIHDHQPSPYLLDKLRTYESLHKKCGPNTLHYKRVIQHLKSNISNNKEDSECNYIVWIERDGLGNRMLSIVSTFLFALLNNRVMLINDAQDSHGLFCEPFPHTSWHLPLGFPIEDYENFWNTTAHSFGKMVMEKSLDMNTVNLSLPSYLYLHLVYDYGNFDKLFYLEEYQALLRSVPWLLVKSNLYFAPAFFLNSQYQEQLNQMFPEKDTVFYHLGRYLFHPSNLVWGYITRYYKAYLAKADQRLGIQIRIYKHSPVSAEYMLGQILNCSLNEGLLPNIISNVGSTPIDDDHEGKLKAVLVTSLHSGYFEKLRDMYYEHLTVDGAVVGVYQPSHEEEQQTWIQNHNVKALAELYLLSFCDELVTTAWSTYGYVAQALAGLRPWTVRWYNDPDTYCVRSASMEPCFFDGGVRKLIDREAKVQNVKSCETFTDGLKMFN